MKAEVAYQTDARAFIIGEKWSVIRFHSVHMILSSLIVSSLSFAHVEYR